MKADNCSGRCLSGRKRWLIFCRLGRRPLQLLFLTCAIRAHAITLDAALAQTLERNPEIQQARIALEGAAGRRVVLHSVAYPDVRLDVFGGDQGGHRAGEASNQPFAFARGGFIQPVFNLAVPASWRRGDIEVLLAEQQLNVAIIDQLHAARVAFYTALYNRALGQLGGAQRERLAGNVASEMQRYEAGNTDRGAVAAARSLEEQLEPRIEEANRGYGAALLTLTQSTAAPANADAELPNPEGELRLRTVDFDVATESKTALVRRADLQLARLVVRAAEADQRMIEAAYFPRIDAIGSGTYIPVTVRRGNSGTGQRANDVISSEVRGGGAFTWRVIDNGKTIGASMRQHAIREMNELVLHRLEANVPRELERIRNTLTAIHSRQEALTSAATAADQNVITIQQNLGQGVASQLEFRTAETSYLQTKTALLTAAFEQNVAIAEWDRVTGRYFQFADETAERQH
ncbi:MAG: TolC family protein [Chthoniobacterales bacterium]